MLTGDNHEVAKEVGEELGFDDVKSELLPNDKAEIVQNLIKTRNI